LVLNHLMWSLWDHRFLITIIVALCKCQTVPLISDFNERLITLPRFAIPCLTNQWKQIKYIMVTQLLIVISFEKEPYNKNYIRHKNDRLLLLSSSNVIQVPVVWISGFQIDFWRKGFSQNAGVHNAVDCCAPLSF